MRLQMASQHNGAAALCMFRTHVKKERDEAPPAAPGSPSSPAVSSIDTTATANTVVPKNTNVDTFVNRIFGSKARYNSFNFRFKNASEDTKQEYAELKKSGTDQELKDFVEVIITNRGYVRYYGSLACHRKFSFVAAKLPLLAAKCR